MAVPETPGSRQSGQVRGLDDAKFISQEVANRLYDGTIEFLRRQAPAGIGRAGPVYQPLRDIVAIAAALLVGVGRAQPVAAIIVDQSGRHCQRKAAVPHNLGRLWFQAAI